MDKSKAKKAVKKAESRKKTTGAAEQVQAIGTGGIDPEIQAPVSALQPADGYVNPYRALGAMAPTTYSAGNMLDGYNYPRMVNPEA
jgi:hypothetical protein